ncbi:MAG: DUF3794 domain-containing protein [Lachnospiraceae bacterium]|nr:DUF3794 domain-containing protein [Lachnospiraceae bacterium]
MTLEEDINVADNKPDIDKIVKLQGDVLMGQITPFEERVTIKGELAFSLLYITGDDLRPIHNMQGQIPFEETINMEGLQPESDVLYHFELEDLQAKLINSRKVSIRALLALKCCQEEQKELAAGTDIVSSLEDRADQASPDTPEGLYCLYDEFALTKLTSQKKDVFRIRDQVILPKGKPNVETILYYEMDAGNLQHRPVDGGIRFLGDLKLFVLYLPENEERRLEYLDIELPFDDVLSCEECGEEMIPDIELLFTNKLLELRPDEDGENRILEVELNLNFRIRFYEDEHFKYLKDAYSTKCTLNLEKKQIDTRKLLMKNQSILRITDRIQIADSSQPILQICNPTGTVKIDEQTIITDGIELEGIVELDILYITEDDAMPLSLAKGTLPFTHVIEIKGISPGDDYELDADISQINVMMLDGQEIEAKVTLNLCAFVFTHRTGEIITGIEETPLDMERLQEMPGVIGYIAEEKEDLWDIAKSCNTTVEDIMSLNSLDRDYIGAGERILLVKQIDGM